MSFKYGSATKAVREIPVIKYAKKLGNQLLNNLKYLREGVTMGPKAYCVQYKLEYPPDGMEDEADSRPFIGKVSFYVAVVSFDLDIIQADCDLGGQGSARGEDLQSRGM